ncbi:hypothetical protein G7Y79_00014g036550 [Physcia stellaris]|nr:hypothetical protein G7Y79_00014g036550 [Physcia stellaris]
MMATFLPKSLTTELTKIQFTLRPAHARVPSVSKMAVACVLLSAMEFFPVVIALTTLKSLRQKVSKHFDNFDFTRLQVPTQGSSAIFLGLLYPSSFISPDTSIAIAKPLYKALDLLIAPHLCWESLEWLLSWLYPRLGSRALAYIAVNSLGVWPVYFDCYDVKVMALDQAFRDFGSGSVELGCAMTRIAK